MCSQKRLQRRPQRPRAQEKGQVDQTGPQTPPVACHQDIRCYIITKHPTGLVGFISGPGATTWGKIEQSFPNKRLVGSGAKLRRVKDLDEAKVVWEAAHGGKPLPLLSPIDGASFTSKSGRGGSCACRSGDGNCRD